MARLIRRVVGALCIISALVLTQIPAGIIKAAPVAKEDFLMDNNTLVKYTGTASTVSVSDDVKIIGEEAFADNQYLGVINIGKNVNKIEHGAFANCTYLNRVVIPDSVKTVDSAAFSGCYGLKNISIGDGVEDFGDGVFAGCSNLAGISVSRNNDKLAYEAGILYDKKKEQIYAYLTANPYEIYYMPESVNSISPYSFWGNTNLSEVYLSGALEEVPAYAFSNCKNLEKVQIPYSVDSIDAKAFENCISLTDVIIPASVKYIDSTAFDGCYNLNIIADEGTEAYKFFANFDKSDVAIAESQDTKNLVKTIKDSSIEKKNSNNTNTSYSSEGYIDASKDPSNVEWMPSVNPLSGAEDSSLFGKTIIVGGNALLFVNRDMEVNQLTNEEVAKQLEEYVNSDEQENTVVYDSGKGGYLPKYTYINGNIATQAFYASNNVEDFNIKAGTKKIGKFSFARSSVTEIVIPDGVEEIGYGAFYHCDNLQSVVVPDSVKVIEAYAFENTPFKTKYTSEAGSDPFYIVGDGILLGYSGTDKNVVIPDGVKTVSAGCFAGNKQIESVCMPSSLTLIDTDAFRDCINLKNVSGGENVKTIGSRAFMGCPVLSFTITSNIKEVGLRAFDFSNLDVDDSDKVVVFNGNILPKVIDDSSSKRLSNYSYRQDALYNVIFAVVDGSLNDFEDTILDNDTLGFSGIILSIEMDAAGNETGNVNIKKNYIYSQEVLDKLPTMVSVGNKQYNIVGKENIQLAQNPYSASAKNKDIVVESSVEGTKAYFSEIENVQKLIVNTSTEAKNSLNNSYKELFGETIDGLTGYDIYLKDDKGVINIDKLGKTDLYISIPTLASAGKYHVISLDSDGQLEELPVEYNSENKIITFKTNHLSYFGIYSTGDDNLVLNIKDGKLVKNYRLDESPDTGDKGFSIYYVYSILLVSTGLILILYKRKKY